MSRSDTLEEIESKLVKVGMRYRLLDKDGNILGWTNVKPDWLKERKS